MDNPVIVAKVRVPWLFGRTCVILLLIVIALNACQIDYVHVLSPLTVKALFLSR